MSAPRANAILPSMPPQLVPVLKALRLGGIVNGQSNVTAGGQMQVIIFGQMKVLV